MPVLCDASHASFFMRLALIVVGSSETELPGVQQRGGKGLGMKPWK